TSWQCANFIFAQYRQLVTLIEIDIFYIKTSMLCRPLQLHFKHLTDGNKRPKMFLYFTIFMPWWAEFESNRTEFSVRSI
ncbi:hypothetical protein, partial [Bartonella sp. CL29QHWL]|uniref:hypothetical protein n=1 Tax=Bartonella sp. CL29QHWL TaxID=3243522 RepID=UPI0035CFBE3B